MSIAAIGAPTACCGSTPRRSRAATSSSPSSAATRARAHAPNADSIAIEVSAMTDPTPDLAPDVARHYGRGGLLDRLLGALAAAGKDIERLTIDDLAPVDEFHSRQRTATAELARLLAPQPGAHVIDIGSGLGGPSRYLATTFGCQVSGVDLTAEFVDVATELTRRTGLPDRVAFRHGSALDLPFPDA